MLDPLSITNIEKIEPRENISSETAQNHVVYITPEITTSKTVTSINSDSKHIETIYSIFDMPADGVNTCKQIIHIAAKAFLSIACFISSFSGLRSAARNFDNIILQNLFAYGEAISWGVLSVYYAVDLYYDMLEKPSVPSKQHMNKCALITHWPAVIALGLLSELPTAYTTYYYNEDTLFWCIYTPAILSIFSIASNHQLFNKLQGPSSIIKRIPWIGITDLKTLSAQHKFCKLIKYSGKALSKTPSTTFESKISLIQSSQTNKKQICSQLILEVLQVGLKQVKDQIASKSYNIQIIEKGTKYISSAFCLGSPILDGILIYNGYHVLFKNNWPIPFIIIFAVAPGIYLQVKLTQKFYVGLVRQALSLRNCPPIQLNCNSIKSMVFTVFKCILVGVCTILGLATDTTVVRDNVGFKSIFGVLVGISVISTMAILLITSMHSFLGDFFNFFQKKRRSIEEVKYDNLIDGIALLEGYFKSLTTDDFKSVLKEINFNHSMISILSEVEFENMLFTIPQTIEVTTDPRGRELIDRPLLLDENEPSKQIVEIEDK